MNIVKVLKSFDIFNSEAVRFLKEKTINIFLVETASSKCSGVNVDNSKNAININVINRPKTYSLMVSANKRLQEKRAKAKQVAKL